MSETNLNCCDSQVKQTLHPLDDTIERLKDLAAPIDAIETVPLLKANKRVLAQELTSSISVPPADNSAVDGYALNIDDFCEDTEFEVSQRIPAGQQAQTLQRGTIARIFTGASIPDGANCVIMQEQASVDDSSAKVRFSST